MATRFAGFGPQTTKILSHESGLHSEWNRRFGFCSLIAVAGVTILSSTYGFLLTNLFSVSQSTSPPLTSVLLASILYLISGEQNRVISRRIPLNGLLYNFAFTSHSELLAFVIGWSQLFDGVQLLTILVKVLSEIMKMLFCYRMEQVVPSESVVEQWPVTNYSDWILIVSAMLIMMCSLRVVSTVSIVFMVAILFTVTSTTVVALLHNIVHLQVHYIGFPYNYQEIMDGTEALIVGVMAVEVMSYVSQETENPTKVLPQLFRYLPRGMCVLLLIGTMAFFPFSLRRPFTDTKLLPSTFDTIGIFSARYLLNVGLVCGLSATVCIAYIGPTRILCQMADDGLVPRFLGHLYGKGGSPRLSVFIVTILTFVFSLAPRQLLSSTLPASIMLRLFTQSILVYNNVIPDPKDPADDDNINTRYNSLGESRCSSIADQKHSIIDSTYSEITSESEEEHALEKVWKVNGNEETSLINGLTKTYDTLPQNKYHNCLTSSCNHGSSVLQRYHMYDPEEQYERTVICKEQSNRSFGIDKTPKNGRRALTLHLISAVMIALSSTIIRETTEYLPIMPIITLTVGLVSSLCVSIWILNIRPEDEKERWIPGMSVVTIFTVIQLLFHIKILTMVPIVIWDGIGLLLYLLCLCQRTSN
ncbi:unnamed protein product [Bursaphelenchus okinawaensis]|uniref:Aa_trans domain-containing protein n=1 Tax=Bursaphelenchus okinawaensis TaxID=465554 RepID=A0A811K7Q6_9BILA|nr:unnamed protein product [Bursaphelenchus okinawaensis]CAG9093420.1 unnamed protein product [Bursaphelenchus okinawaensis]